MQPPHKKPKTEPLVGLAHSLAMDPMGLVAEGVNETLEVCVALAGLEATRVELDGGPGWVGGSFGLDDSPAVLRIAPGDLRLLQTTSPISVETLLDLREVAGRENPPHPDSGWSYAWRVAEPLDVTVFSLLVRASEWSAWMGRRGKPSGGSRTVSPAAVPTVVQIEHVVTQREAEAVRRDEQAHAADPASPPAKTAEQQRLLLVAALLLEQLAFEWDEKLNPGEYKRKALRKHLRRGGKGALTIPAQDLAATGVIDLLRSTLKKAKLMGGDEEGSPALKGIGVGSDSLRGTVRRIEEERRRLRNEGRRKKQAK